MVRAVDRASMPAQATRGNSRKMATANAADISSSRRRARTRTPAAPIPTASALGSLTANGEEPATSVQAWMRA